MSVRCCELLKEAGVLGSRGGLNLGQGVASFYGHRIEMLLRSRDTNMEGDRSRLRSYKLSNRTIYVRWAIRKLFAFEGKSNQ